MAISIKTIWRNFVQHAETNFSKNHKTPFIRKCILPATTTKSAKLSDFFNTYNGILLSAHRYCSNYQSSQVDKKVAIGEYDEAIKMSQQAKTLSILSVILGVVFVIFYIIIIAITSTALR